MSIWASVAPGRTVVDTEIKAEKIVKRKSLSGKGKLTAKMIDKLNVYYGPAIRRNHDSVEKMKNAIWATYYHYSSTDENPHHEKCPSGEDSWSEWQKAAASDALELFKRSPSYWRSGSHEAHLWGLEQGRTFAAMFGGFTQNNNESLNQLIWKISPKRVSRTSTVVEIAANVAACTFNEGFFALFAFMQEMQIGAGPSSHEWARQVDALRISRAEEQAAHGSKEGRVLRRQIQTVCESGFPYCFLTDFTKFFL